ncbi:hypothetical protein FPC62_26705 [Salmonella enterica]|uniref:Uncharacterized protein n=1 Tax=Salmonella enterica TaxID=28901 RepID=A0A5V3WGH5_SALER|nr:hypothetical protein [Salmonella enterica]EDD5833168.1 hypothetical protein [Salmonella enterica subsp. enterica serovar Enteritidis]EBN4400200.1 hypothetical protein [Salmonella enterica]EBU0743648.1 hypothetical protein [Salmonella enterica]ECH3817560.1 hypothetical protein [Salmonella enterica]
MFMLLCSNSRRNKYDPDTFINVRQVYGATLVSRDQSVPVKSTFGTTMDSAADLQKPVKAVYGYLLVTEV